MSRWYSDCDDARRHEREAQEDARYGSRSHQPDRWGDEACYRVYADAYRAEEYRQEEKAAEEAAEARRLAHLEAAREEARQLEEQQEAEYYRQQEEDYHRGLAEQAAAEPQPEPPSL